MYRGKMLNLNKHGFGLWRKENRESEYAFGDWDNDRLVKGTI